MKKYTSHILTALAVSSFCLTLAAHTVSIASAEPPSTVANAPEDAFHKQFRKQIYEAYPPVSATAKELKTSGYNQFENPTGIVFEEGDTIIVKASGIPSNVTPELRITNFGSEDWKDSRYPLKNGVNKIKALNKGHGYISYYTDHYKTAPKLKISIEGGKANGYFDSAIHNNDTWKRLLAGAGSNIMDIKGKRVQLAYPVQALKEQCPENGFGLIGLYDRIITFEHEIMGLDKYNRVPKNRMFGRVIWKGFMHADGIGAAFHNDTMKELANIEKLMKGPWGVAHEFGHVNQVRPGMKWVSTTEVTNNIYSIWIQFKLNPSYINLEQEHHNDGDGNHVTGGRFNSFLQAALINGEQWLCQKGPDKLTDYQNGGDHFVKLCPLWQLQLYCNVAGKGNPDTYPDIFEIVRKQNDAGISNGQHQLNFMKNVCDVNKQDFTDFFKAVGMLKPIDKDMDDYSRAQLTITQEQCDALVDYAKKYPKPESPVVYYITSGSVDAYRDKLPVTGTYNQGVTEEGKTRKIDHSVWKNVTVFETYAGDKMTNIAIWGTGAPDKSSTLVQYPEGSTRIEAVAWDGQRTLVTGKR